MNSQNNAAATTPSTASGPLSEEDLLAAARALVETSADLIGENVSLTRRVTQNSIALAALARGLDSLAAKLDGELKDEVLGLLDIARQD